MHGRTNPSCAGLTRRNLIGAGAALAAIAATPALGKLSILKGNREIISISDGGFVMPAAMLGNRPASEITALLKASNLPGDTSSTVLNVTLIRDGADYTIIDCGAGANFLPGSGKLAANLEAAGIAKEAIKRVLFTHAHPDHLWGAIDDFDTDLFPNASYLIPEAEWGFWSDPGVYSRLPEDRHAFAAGAQRIFKAIGEKTSRFRPGAEVAPGILAVDTSGHTPGHVSFEISAGNERLMVLGDALTHPVISFRHPDWQPASDADGARAAASRKALLDRLASDRIPVIGYHLPPQGLGRVERDGTAYRFVAIG